MQLTEDQKEWYIRYPNECPYCESTNIESPSSESEHKDEQFTAKVYCIDCRKAWTEVYTLTDIIEE